MRAITEKAAYILHYEDYEKDWDGKRISHPGWVCEAKRELKAKNLEDAVREAEIFLQGETEYFPPLTFQPRIIYTVFLDLEGMKLGK